MELVCFERRGHICTSAEGVFEGLRIHSATKFLTEELLGFLERSAYCSSTCIYCI